MRSKANHVRWLLCVLFLLVTGYVVPAQVPVPNPSGPPNIIYVDADTTGANTGSSWEHAINSLQDALLVACFYDKPVEIRVSQGIYTPDRGVGIMPGDREASFQLINGVTIKGGYAGFGQNHDARYIALYGTILSGDLDGNDGPEFTNNSENSYHVVTGSGTDATAMLDGFTITGGNAEGPLSDNRGGGMYNDKSSPTLTNCTFSGNSAGGDWGGGGMYNFYSSPTLVNCAFSANSTTGHGCGMSNDSSNPALLNCMFSGNLAMMSGGGMYNYKSSPTLTNCTFIRNSGGGGGGGMYNDDSSPMLADCAFSANSTTGRQGRGGGMYNSDSNPALLNCTFSGNSALRSGGGMYNYQTSEPSLINCIFSGNSAGSGGGMESLDASRPTLLNCTFNANFAENAGGGISNIQDVEPMLFNCILWGNTPEEIKGSASVSYSDVQGGWPGEGNIDAAPYFVDPDNGDYHLRSQAGRWDPNSESWVIDDTSSPCIDAGDPNDPVGLERFSNGDRINMGAYGGTPEASLSLRLLPLPGQALNPSPADGAIVVEINIKLSWIAGLNAVSHGVHFGTDYFLPLVSNQTTTQFDPGTLDADTTYFWRIDEVDSEGYKTTGAVWTFTTNLPSPPPKGRGCFTSETGVWVDGALVPISKVGLGQNVGRIDSANVGGSSVPLPYPGKVEKLQEHEGTFACYDVLLESGNCVSVAECHYFLVESGRWVSLQNLKTGTRLQTSKGSIGIISVTRKPMPYVGKVYNLKIEGSDWYLVGEDAVIVRDY